MAADTARWVKARLADSRQRGLTGGYRQAARWVEEIDQAVEHLKAGRAVLDLQRPVRAADGCSRGRRLDRQSRLAARRTRPEGSGAELERGRAAAGQVLDDQHAVAPEADLGPIGEHDREGAGGVRPEGVPRLQLLARLGRAEPRIRHQRRLLAAARRRDRARDRCRPADRLRRRRRDGRGGKERETDGAPHGHPPHPQETLGAKTNIIPMPDRPANAFAILSRPARLWTGMDFDQLLVRFFGTDAIADLPAEQIAAGVDRLQLQIGLERDSGRRFALWCLAYMLGAAPDLDVAFKAETDRDAARDFMDTVDREIEADD